MSDAIVPNRKTPGVLAKYREVSGAVLYDLEQEHVEVVVDIRQLEAEAKRAQESEAALRKSEIADLDALLPPLRSNLVEIGGQEAQLFKALKEAENEAENEAKLASAPQLEKLENEEQLRKEALDKHLAREDLGLEALEEQLQAQQEREAEAYAKAGRRPGQDEALLVSTVEPESVAIEKDMVLDASDKQPVPEPISWGVSLVSGVASGFSLGLAAHFIHPDTVHREVVLASIFSGFGVATSIAMKYGLESLWLDVSLRLHQSQKWVARTTVALGITLFLIGIYSTVEQRGLMQGIMVDNLITSIRDPQTSPAGGNTSGESNQKPVDAAQIQLAATVGSLFLTVPYVLLVSTSGFRKGRHMVHLKQAHALRSRELQKMEETQRHDPAIQSAFLEKAKTAIAQERMSVRKAKNDAKTAQLRSEIDSMEASQRELREQKPPITRFQQQTLDDLSRLAADRQRIEGEIASIEDQKRQVSKRVVETYADKKLKEARERQEVIEGRINYLKEQARQQLEPMQGNLFQRLKFALKKPETGVGMITYSIKNPQKRN